jgi:hypothetical protein
MMENDTLDLVSQYRRNLDEKFEFFLKEIWRLDRGFVPSRLQVDYSRWIAYGPARCGAIGFRGMAKTWIACAACLWWLFRDKEEKILLISPNEDYAKMSLILIRGWMETIPFLQPLIPTKDQRDSTTNLDVAGCKIDRIASLRALGITGKLPGGRASKIIVDDAEQPENTLTQQMRELLWQRIGEVEPILVPETATQRTKPAIRFLGTYQHVESIYDRLQKPDPTREYKPYTFRNWPIQYPEPDIMTPILSPMLRRDLEEGRARPGDPVWPQRFGKSYIFQIPLGRTKFLQQFMGYQDAAALSRYPLRLQDLIVYPVHKTMAPVNIQWGKSSNRGSTACEGIPTTGFGDDRFYAPIMISDQWVEYCGCKGYLDPAGRGEDEMTLATAGQLHGYIFNKRVLGVNGGPTEDNLDLIVEACRADHVHELFVEDTFGGEALIRLIEMTIAKFMLPADKANTDYPNGWSCVVIPYHAQSRGQKEVWICDTLETVCSHHRLVVSEETAKDVVLWAQFVNMTRERNCQKHEDRVEALAGVVAQFGELMGSSPESQRKALEDRKRQERYEQYCKRYKIPMPIRTWSGIDPRGFGGR